MEIYCSLFALSCLESLGTKHEQGISSQQFSQRLRHQEGCVCTRVLCVCVFVSERVSENCPQHSDAGLKLKGVEIFMIF